MSALDPQRTTFKHRSPSRRPSQYIRLFCRSQSEAELSPAKLPGPDAHTVRCQVPAHVLSHGGARARRRSRGPGGDGVRLLGVCQRLFALQRSPRRKQSLEHSLCCLSLKNKHTAKDLSMFEKSLHVKGRDRKRQTATRKLQEADNAHKRKLKKKKKSNN